MKLIHLEHGFQMPYSRIVSVDGTMGIGIQELKASKTVSYYHRLFLIRLPCPSSSVPPVPPSVYTILYGNFQDGDAQARLSPKGYLLVAVGFYGTIGEGEFTKEVSWEVSSVSSTDKGIIVILISPDGVITAIHTILNALPCQFSLSWNNEEHRGFFIVGQGLPSSSSLCIDGKEYIPFSNSMEKTIKSRSNSYAYLIRCIREGAVDYVNFWQGNIAPYAILCHQDVLYITGNVQGGVRIYNTYFSGENVPGFFVMALNVLGVVLWFKGSSLTPLFRAQQSEKDLPNLFSTGECLAICPVSSSSAKKSLKEDPFEGFHLIVGGFGNTELEIDGRGFSLMPTKGFVSRWLGSGGLLELKSLDINPPLMHDIGFNIRVACLNTRIFVAGFFGNMFNMHGKTFHSTNGGIGGFVIEWKSTGGSEEDVCIIEGLEDSDGSYLTTFKSSFAGEGVAVGGGYKHLLRIHDHLSSKEAYGSSLKNWFTLYFA